MKEDAHPLTTEGKRPFFLMSHGYGGCGTGHTFLTEELARRGWIVAAPDHEDPDKTCRIREGRQDFRPGLFLRNVKKLVEAGRNFDFDKYGYRFDEARLALDALLDSPTFGPLIDTHRIGAGGHSFGGYTTLGLVGAAERLVPDRRIKALVLLSPGLFMYGPDDFARVDVPTIYMLGEEEADQPRNDGTNLDLAHQATETMAPPCYFLLIEGAHHFSFSDRGKKGLFARRRGGTEEELSLIRDYSVDFLELYVDERDDAGATLDRRDPRLIEYLVHTPEKQSRAGAQLGGR